MTARRHDVLVAGGGIVGLAAAVALRVCSAGFLRVAIVAPGGEAAPDPRALAVVAGSRRLLETVGAWEAIAPEAEPMREIAVADGRLADVARPFLLGFTEDAFEAGWFAHVAPAEAIQRALRARAAAVGVESVPAAVVGRRVRSGSTELDLDDGGTVEAALAIAADGGRSTLRRLAGVGVHAWTYGQRALVATVAHERPHEGRAVQHFLPGGPFALLPMRGDRSAVVWSEAEDEAVRIAASPDDVFMAELGRRAGSDLGGLRLAGPRGTFPLSGAVARALTADRLALVGDAARVLHPIAGQGVNLGLRDVAALAECIIDAARLGLDLGGPEVLSRYERWRRFESVAFLAATDALNRLFRLDDPTIRTMRDVGLGVVDRWPGLKRGFVRAAAGLAGEPPRLVQGLAP